MITLALSLKSSQKSSRSIIILSIIFSNRGLSLEFFEKLNFFKLLPIADMSDFLILADFYFNKTYKSPEIKFIPAVCYLSIECPIANAIFSLVFN